MYSTKFRMYYSRVGMTVFDVLIHHDVLQTLETAHARHKNFIETSASEPLLVRVVSL